MKLRTVITLWIITIVLGIAAYLVKFHDQEEIFQSTKLEPGDRLFERLPILDMYAVRLTQGDQITHLIRGKDNQWSVKERDQYPIDYKLLGDLLGALDTLDVTQGYPVASQYFERFGLGNEITEEQKKRGYEGAIKVTMLGKDGDLLAEIALGKFSGTSRVGGRFISITGDDSGVYTVEQAFPGVTADPKDWLEKGFLEINQMQSISVSAPTDSTFKSWELVRSNSRLPFQLGNMRKGEIMQLTSTNAFRNLFANSEFQDVLDENRAKEKGIPDETFRRHAVIKTFDGFSYTLELWPQKQPPKDPNADDRLPPSPPSYNITVNIDLNFPKERQKGALETPEETKELDEQFTQAEKMAKEKFTATKAFEGKIFQIGHSHIAPLLKLRTDFVKP